MAKEEWRDIPGWPGYRASTMGRIYSYKMRGGRCGCILKRLVGPDDYPQVNLHHAGRRSTKKVHILIGLAFIGPRPDGMELRHLDGDKQNAALSNLEYGTRSQNYEDARKHGTYSHGERHGKATVTAEDVREIRRLRREGKYLRELAALFGQSTTNISDICNRKTWTHIGD